MIASGEVARKLTSTIRKERDTALVSLFNSLDTTKTYSEKEWLDFFNVLFYHFWLSDKQYVQHHLADVISEQMLTKSDFAFNYLKYFWVYMSKQWHNLDFYRLDKYYDLFRRMHLITFKLLHINDNSASVFNTIMSILRGDLGPLGNDNLDLPDGIRFHTLEVILDEFCKSCSENEQVDAFPLALLNPDHLFTFCFSMLDLYNNSRNVGVLQRLMDDVLIKLLHLLKDVEHDTISNLLQFYTNIIYSFPTHYKCTDMKREKLFDLVKMTGIQPVFIEFTEYLQSVPELVSEGKEADAIIKEYDVDLKTSSEPRVLEGEKLDIIKEIRSLWRVDIKATNSTAEEGCYYPIDAMFSVVPKCNYDIPEMHSLRKCKHNKNVHFKMNKNKVKHFHKRQPPNYISK